VWFPKGVRTLPPPPDLLWDPPSVQFVGHFFRAKRWKRQADHLCRVYRCVEYIELSSTSISRLYSVVLTPWGNLDSSIYGYWVLWGSLVSIASDYRLATGVRSPAEEEDFFASLCVQTSSEAHPASCPLGPFPVVKRGRWITLTTHPHLVPSRSYISSPPWRLHGGSGTALLYKNHTKPTFILRDKHDSVQCMRLF
jgi:hypothetical protein